MPKPSPLWYPTNLQDQAAWHVVFAAQATADGTAYGLTAGEVTQIEADKDMVVSLAATMNTIDAYVDSVRAFRKDVLESPINGGTPTFPANMILTLADEVPRGIWERVIKFADRIKASAPYTISVGESYGIVPSSPDPIAPTLVQPTVDTSAALHGYLYKVLVSKREEADSWQVFARPAGGGAWQLAATATGKIVEIIYDPGEITGSIQLEVYVQLRKNNENYGQPSEINLVTVNQ